MENLKEIIEKIESPLIFSSRDSYKNLSLIKNLELTMTGLLKKLKAISPLSAQHGTAKEAYSNILSGLQETFAGFETLSVDEKRGRVGGASRLVKELKNLYPDLSQSHQVKSLDKSSPMQEELNTSFEKLSLSVQYVKGVGPKVARLLGKKGIKTVEDILYFLPRRYEDRRLVKMISSTQIGNVEMVIGEVKEAQIQQYRKNKVFEVTVDDGSGRLTAKWFKGNYTYLRKILKKGARVILTGEIRSFLFGKDIIHPDFEILDEKDDNHDNLLHFKRIVPVYSETEGLHQKYIRKIMMGVVENYSRYILSPIPEEICKRQHLADINHSIRNIHFPESDQDIEQYNNMKSEAYRRLVFDEFFFFELGMALKKKGYVLEKGILFKTDGKLNEKFLQILPFELTDAQNRVIEEIKADMKSVFPMHRLLQGDVGCGKTAVSMAAMICACENGYQAAIMAPTEILAEQHYSNIKGWAGLLGLKVAILTGSKKTAERRDVCKKIESGDVDIIIGTHALIQEGVEFKKLGFVVIDEQHRFGVVQRATLRGKGINPDVLVMTATPIPRSLAMTVYGDLDISVIDEMPPGKKPIRTKVFYEKSRDKVYETIDKELKKGNQTFVVYPLVEESETLDLKDATRMAEHLQKEIFPEYRVGLIHGRMKGTEKDEIMTDFSEGTIDILVSTTVIEVGIDIPQASLMVVEHAERFGLSQLHQLRGRVGRSDIPSYCILLAGYARSDTARKRLRIMEETNDGFRIAEEDLAIRGPGEFMGTRQSGLPDFRVANILRDGRILNEARREAFSVVEDDPFLEKPGHSILKEVLLKRWEGRLDLAKTG
ncbi:MAG: ATP-dependent DNA helicase RecG [Syntrophales bacterium]|nr:ATP-dependent DNA helicase RecG [Syntrophales bacterium]